MEMAALTQRINASTGRTTRVRDQQLVEKASVKILKDGENNKSKRGSREIKKYTGLCVCPDGCGDDFGDNLMP